jgi:hypothetical protein
VEAVPAYSLHEAVGGPAGSRQVEVEEAQGPLRNAFLGVRSHGHHAIGALDQVLAGGRNPTSGARFLHEPGHGVHDHDREDHSGIHVIAQKAAATTAASNT